MGVQFTQFRLYQYISGEECVHELLVRVNHPSYPNHAQAAENAAGNFADSAANHLRTWWERWLLPTECRREHQSTLVETAHEAVTDELYGLGLRRLIVWLIEDEEAELFLVAAANEEELKKQLRDYYAPDAVPALRQVSTAHDVYFLTERDGEGDLHDA